MSNGDWVQRSLKSVWHPCTQMQHHETVPLIPVSHGRGAWLVDVEGKRYLDAISSWWVNLFGHANPRINAALKDQLDRLEHAMLAGFTHEPVIALSEQLSARTGHVLGHCFYASDGASAVEIALKMSFHAWRNNGNSNKREFVCLKGSYHGETVGALAVTDVPLFRDAYGPMLRQAHVVDAPDARAAQEGESAADVARRAAQKLEALFAERADHIAAVIVEPLVQCAAGMAMCDPVYLTEVRALCDRYSVHMIADENAVGCRAALATLASFDEDDVIKRNRQRAERLTQALAPLAAHPRVRHFRRRGMIWAFDAAIDDPAEAATFARRFFTQALSHELLLRPIGRTVYLMPPYVLNDEEANLLAARTLTVFEQVIGK